MNSDIHIAFDYPEARAAATAGRDPLDRISLRDHTVEVDIGAFQSERGTTQRVCFNVVVEVRQLADPLDDDVDRILSYDTISQAIQLELAAERLNLLETLAAGVAKRVLTEPQAQRVFVRIEKLDRGPGALGVEIVRSKQLCEPHRAESLPQAQDVPHPLVIYLSNRAIASSNLPGWLDELEHSQKPVILCVGMPNETTPQSVSGPVQNRIDLLAMDQNAWVLAGLDQRCVVTGTRTELDWAARRGRFSVWAPSKLVLDAVDGPTTGTSDAPSLAGWLAGEVYAERMVVIDANPPEIEALETSVVNLGNLKLF